MENIAAIDIGSNAIRLMIGSLDSHHDIQVIKKMREPVRLGQDVFAHEEISRKTMTRALETFEKFAKLIAQNQVRHVRAIATSAMREAPNAKEFITEVKRKTGLSIEVIDGIEEARLIHTAVSHRVNLEQKNAVLIDIGGGSVELTVSVNGKTRGMQSFPLGTVRLLQIMSEKNLKEKNLRSMIHEHIGDAQKFVQDCTRGKPIDFSIGTGGNFECLGKLRVALLHRNSIYSMSRHELHQLVQHLESMSIKERIQFLRLRPDRADVVVPAALVAHEIMSLIPVETLLVPYVGLRDGILFELGARIQLPARSAL
jgi:exopolyphosphatase/guanosine-5'-triphosphate,3'-diphosphate pyrophosphatase